METSAQLNENVENAFLELVKTIYENTGDDTIFPP
jgi:GTPase SAR1 family protein